MTTAKFSEILDGYEFCALADLMDTQAFVSLERGTVHIVSGDLELDQELPELLKPAPTWHCRESASWTWAGTWRWSFRKSTFKTMRKPSGVSFAGAARTHASRSFWNAEVSWPRGLNLSGLPPSLAFASGVGTMALILCSSA